MNNDEAIAKLHSLVDRIPILLEGPWCGEDYRKWKSDVQIALKWIFKDDPKAADDLESAVYLLGSGGRSASSAERTRALGDAKSLLESRMNEIGEFWTTESVQSNGRKLPAAPRNPEVVFVIHGRQKLGDFHDFLRAIGLKPLEWSQARRLTGKTNPYTWEIVDTALTEAGAIVALMTPDDEARLREELWSEKENSLEKVLLPQPRQNVLFEAGVAFGRAPERTILVRLGSHRPMSDLAGHHILTLNDSPESRQSVADALKVAGCPVDLSNADWFRSRKFE